MMILDICEHQALGTTNIILTFHYTDKDPWFGDQTVKLFENLSTLLQLLDQSKIYRDKTVANKLMYISNDDTQNYPFCRLKLVVETFGHSTK